MSSESNIGMTWPRCRACPYWSPVSPTRSGFYERGKCSNPNRYGKPANQDPYKGKDAADLMWTGPDFGCIHHVQIRHMIERHITIEFFRAQRVGTYPHKRDRWMTITIQEERLPDSPFVPAEVLYRQHSPEGNQLMKQIFDSLPEKQIDALLAEILASYEAP